MELYDNLLETLGNTPLVRLDRYSPTGASLAVKVESFNPGSSVKDRIGIAMIEAAEREGKLEPGQLIVEPTSGNTGVGLAIAAILKGYKLVCTAADKMPAEKKALLQAYGVEVITCPTGVDAGRSTLLLQGSRAHPRRGGRVPALPVLQPGQSDRALREHGTGDLAAD